MAHGAVLTGPRVVLRAPRLDDADALFANVTSDPEVTRYLAWTPHPDVAETRRVITELYNVGVDALPARGVRAIARERQVRAPARGCARTWLIEVRDTAEVVGLCACTRSDGHAVEVGYCLARDWWGRRLMSEALGVILEMLQRDPRLYRVWATCHVDNSRSAGLLKRAGFTLEGRLARYGMYPNLSPEPQDCLMFARALR